MRANRVLRSFLIANISFTVNFILRPNWPLSEETILFKQSHVYCEALRKTRRRQVSEVALGCRYFLQRARCCSNLTGTSETHTGLSRERFNSCKICDCSSTGVKWTEVDRNRMKYTAVIVFSYPERDYWRYNENQEGIHGDRTKGRFSGNICEDETRWSEWEIIFHLLALKHTERQTEAAKWWVARLLSCSLMISFICHNSDKTGVTGEDKDDWSVTKLFHRLNVSWIISCFIVMKDQKFNQEKSGSFMDVSIIKLSPQQRDVFRLLWDTLRELLQILVQT